MLTDGRTRIKTGGANRTERRELALNGAGYWDPTAAAAIKKIIKEEREMVGDEFEVAAGDIWALQTDDEKEKLFLVLANRGRYMTGLTLYENTNNPDTIEVVARGQRYTDPGRVSYAHATRLEDFVRALTDEELEGIREEVTEALGLADVRGKERLELPQMLPHEDAQPQIAAGRDGDTQASEEDYRARVDAETTRLIEWEEKRRREAEEKVEQLLDLQAEVERECRGARSEAATYKAKAEAYKEILVRVLPTKGD